MKLSEALLSNEITIDPSRKLRFQALVMERWSDASPELFPIAFGCPLFIGTDRSPECIFSLLPTEVSTAMPVGVHFICDVIDFMAFHLQWNQQRIGEWIQAVEEALVADDRDLTGVKLNVGRRQTTIPRSSSQ